MGDLSRFKLISGGVEAMLNSADTRDMLTERADAVLGAAISAAPVSTGAYRESLHLEQDTTDRAVVRVVADVPYATLVESQSGNLARALDAGR